MCKHSFFCWHCTSPVLRSCCRTCVVDCAQPAQKQAVHPMSKHLPSWDTAQVTPKPPTNTPGKLMASPGALLKHESCDPPTAPTHISQTDGFTWHAMEARVMRSCRATKGLRSFCVLFLLLAPYRSRAAFHTCTWNFVVIQCSQCRSFHHMGHIRLAPYNRAIKASSAAWCADFQASLAALRYIPLCSSSTRLPILSTSLVCFPCILLNLRAPGSRIFPPYGFGWIQ